MTRSHRIAILAATAAAALAIPAGAHAATGTVTGTNAVITGMNNRWTSRE